MLIPLGGFLAFQCWVRHPSVEFFQNTHDLHVTAFGLLVGNYSLTSLYFPVSYTRVETCLYLLVYFHHLGPYLEHSRYSELVEEMDDIHRVVRIKEKIFDEN